MTTTAPPLVGETIPLVCLVDDVCRLLRISRAQYFSLRKRGLFPIPEIEPRVGDPRYHGADVQRYLQGAFAPRGWSRRMKKEQPA